MAPSACRATIPARRTGTVLCVSRARSTEKWNGTDCVPCRDHDSSPWSGTEESRRASHNSSAPFWSGLRHRVQQTRFRCASVERLECVSCYGYSYKTPKWTATRVTLAAPTTQARRALISWAGVCQKCPRRDRIGTAIYGSCEGKTGTRRNGTARRASPATTTKARRTGTGPSVAKPRRPCLDSPKCVSCTSHDEDAPFWEGSRCITCCSYDPSRPHWDGSNVLPAKPMIWENRAGRVRLRREVPR